MLFFGPLIWDAVAERIEGDYLMQRVAGSNPDENNFLKNSCWFVGKIMSVCGKKFGEQNIVLDNSRQFVGKIR